MQAFKQILSYFKPYRFIFLCSIGLLCITASSLIIMPTVEAMITSQIYQDIISANGGPVHISYDIILGIIALLIGVYATKTITQLISAHTLTKAIQSAMRDLKNDLHTKMNQLPISYYDKHSYGDLLSRITNDVESISNAFQQTLTQIIMGSVSIVFAYIMMARIHMGLFCITIFLIPTLLLFSFTFVRFSQKRFDQQQKTLGELNGTIQEQYSGYQEILIHNRQNVSLKEFALKNEQLKNDAFKAQFLSSIMTPLNSLITYTTIAISALYGCLKMMQGQMDPGGIQACIRYIWSINDPLTQVASLSAQIQSAFAAMRRVCEMLNEEVNELEVKASLPTTNAHVAFDHVSFAYDTKTILKDVSFEVKPGQMAAIVGETGAGKTTIISLLMRFYEISQGCILIDGVNIQDLDINELRNHLGMVLQDTWLFEGSILDNLKYGKQDATLEEVQKVARIASIDEMIDHLSEGYDTILAEDGGNLSQGEKQLMTIARALLKDPSILILDEATSSVDTRLEARVQAAMYELLKGRTSIVIAHRLSTIRKADVIYVMKHGQIVEQGNHEQLLQQQGYYYDLYQSQFAHQN